MPATSPAPDLAAEDAAIAAAGGRALTEDDLIASLGAKPAPAFDQSADYLHAAGDALPADIDRTKSYEEQYQQFLAKARAFHEPNPLSRLTGAVGDVIATPGSVGKAATALKDAAGNLAAKGWEGIKSAAYEDYNATVSNPLTASPKIIASTLLGGAKGIYGLGKLAAEGVGKVSDTLDVGETPEQATEDRARRDFMLRYWNSNYEGPARAALDGVTPLPAQAAFAENVAPFFLPGVGEAAGLGVAGKTAEALSEAAPVVAGAVAKGATAVPQLVARGVEKLAPAAGSSIGTVVGGHGGGLLALAGQNLGKTIGNVVSGGAKAVADSDALANLADVGAQFPNTAAADALTNVTRQVLTPALGAAESVGVGAGMGLAGAPSGSEGEGALQGAAFGALASPAAALGTTFARQRAEQTAVTADLAATARNIPIPDPVLDAAHARGRATLAPADAETLDAARGFLQSAPTTSGRPAEIIALTPGEYATRARAVSNSVVNSAEAAQSRGFFRDDTGQIFLNTGHGDVPGAIQTALNHEGSHAAMDAFRATNPDLADRLTTSNERASLDPDTGAPTPAFQRFIDAYNGGRPVDWNGLTDKARAQFLEESLAQTGTALGAMTNPGRFTLAPELSDHIANTVRDAAGQVPGLRRLVLPDLTAGLDGRTDGERAPADPATLAGFRQGLYGLGERGIPFGPPEPPPAPARPFASLPPPTVPPVSAPVAIPRPLAGASAVGLNTPNRAAALAALRKLGFKEAEANARLDAAQAAGTPDVDSALLAHAVSNGRAAVPQLSSLPVKVATTPPSASAPLSRLSADPAAVPVPDLKPPTPVVSESSGNPLAPSAPALDPRLGLQPVPEGVPLDLTGELPPGTTRQVLGNNTYATTPDGRVYVDTNRRFADAGMVASPWRLEYVTRDFERPEQPVPAGLTDTPPPTKPPTAAPAAASPDEPTPPAANRLAGQDTTPPEPGPRDVAAVSNDAPPAAPPLSAEDVARIHAETEAGFTPTPYKPRGTPTEQAQKKADRASDELREARRDAMMEAHAAAVPAGDRRVTQKVDPDTGRTSISGQRFDLDDPVHEHLLADAGVTPEQLGNLDIIQGVMNDGGQVNLDYASAEKVREQTTAAQRRESQAASPAAERAETNLGIKEADKAFVPSGFSVSKKDGAVIVHGYSPDKMVGNAVRLMKVMQDANMGDRLPYEDVNHPQFAADVAGYARNHQHGWKGDGSAPLIATEGVSTNSTPGYEPYRLDPARADFINLVQGHEPTLSSKQAFEDGRATKSAKLRDFAATNDNLPDPTGEVNPLRGELNRRGLLKVAGDEGSKDVLEKTSEDLRLDLIRNLKPAGEAPDFTNLRAQPFRGDRRALTPDGPPRSDFAGAGFLPGPIRRGEISDVIHPDNFALDNPDHTEAARRGMDALGSIGTRLPGLRSVLGPRFAEATRYDPSTGFTVSPLGKPPKGAKVDPHGQYWSDRSGPASMRLADTGDPTVNAIVSSHETAHLFDNVLGGGSSSTGGDAYASSNGRNPQVNALMDYLATTEAAKNLAAEVQRIGNKPGKEYRDIRYLAHPNEVFARAGEQLAGRALAPGGADEMHGLNRPDLTLLQPHELDRAEELWRDIWRSPAEREAAAALARTAGGGAQPAAGGVPDAGGGNPAPDAARFLPVSGRALDLRGPGPDAGGVNASQLASLPPFYVPGRSLPLAGLPATFGPAPNLRPLANLPMMKAGDRR